MSTDSELPDTAMATGNDYQPCVPAGPIDPEERAVLDYLKDPEGPDVVGSPTWTARSTPTRWPTRRSRTSADGRPVRERPSPAPAPVPVRPAPRARRG